MKRVWKWSLRLLLVLAALMALFFIFKDTVLRRMAERQIREQTGMEVSIGSFSSGIFSPVVTIKDFKLYNTPEFGGAIFLDVPELHLALDRAAFAAGKIRVSLLRFHLAELSVVRNEAGQTNIMTLLAKDPKKDRQKKIRIGNRDFEFENIEELELSLGQARFVDLKNPQNNRDVVINMENQIFKNVKEEGDVYGILIMIWLRSGGAFSISPGGLAREMIKENSQKTPAGTESFSSEGTNR